MLIKMSIKLIISILNALKLFKNWIIC